MPESLTAGKEIRRKALARFGAVSATAIVVGYILSLFSFRIDLTEDKRYTLSHQTKRVLSELPGDVYIQVYLEGEMPVAFKKMRRSVRDILDEFKVLSARKVGYDFINPSDIGDQRQRSARQMELINKGLLPVNVQAGDDEGGTTTRMIFPGMIVNYNGIEIPVNFLRNNSSLPPEQNILNSIEGLEYEIIQTIATLASDTIHKVAFIEGHGELDEIEVADITMALARFFTVDRGVIGGIQGILDDYAAVIIAKPTGQFSEADKFVIDQYLMQGGRILWLIDEVYVERDSLGRGETVAIYQPSGLGDQLFRYGARVNPVIIQDMECVRVPLQIIGAGNQPQTVPAPWPYYPLLVPSRNHAITRNLNRIKGEFVNSVDTVGLNTDIRKEILLTTSPYTRTINPPIIISLSEAEKLPAADEFTKSNIPVAVLLEGVFPSVFKNRMLPGLTDRSDMITESKPARMIVIADGDIIRNEVSFSGGAEVPLPLGQDRYSRQTFGNRDFLVNCINWLVDENELVELRSRELKLRLLDKPLIKRNIGLIRLANIILPLILLGITGQFYLFIRRRKYIGGTMKG